MDIVLYICSMMKYRKLLFVCTLLCGLVAFAQPYRGEKLSRGMMGVPVENGMYLSWRMLLDDASDIPFTIYRCTEDGQEKRLNDTPITRTCDFLDQTADLQKSNRWILKSDNKVLAEWSNKGGNCLPYLRIPISRPTNDTVAGMEYSFSVNDCSVGDLDGDGNYEIVLKWSPSNSKRPPEKGFAGKTYLDAYRLDGTMLWRIDLGKNIRSGAATTNFLVFDFDGDGKAEVCCKTGDGTVDGTGKVVGDPHADWRTWDKESPTYGKIVNGPEYISVFEGATGRMLDTKEYIPTRYPLDGWGGIGGNGGNDNTGGRSDRFSAAVALLDGKTPSAVMVRGWYGRTVLAAWNFIDGELKHVWTFDSAEPGLEKYSGMANHSVTVADFDSDGFDEVCVGAMTVDHDGKGLFSTGLRHGDALHAGRFVPARKGLQVFGVHENEGKKDFIKKCPAVAMFDGATGEIIWQDGLGADVGRGVAADIDPRYEGAECWCGYGGLRKCADGSVITEKKPNSCNFTIYWDADSLQELLDHYSISKWNWETETTELLFKPEGVVSNNGTKGNPCLSGDILGDWREEVIWASKDQTELRIYMTTIPAIDRRATLMSDRQYRLAIAWQNVAYNQPPHLSY